MKKLILLTALVLALAGCVGESKESVQDGDFVIELLFEKDGCKVYRFKDGGRFVYWSNCRGELVHYYSSGGKNHSSNLGQSFTTKEPVSPQWQPGE